MSREHHKTKFYLLCIRSTNRIINKKQQQKPRPRPPRHTIRLKTLLPA